MLNINTSFSFIALTLIVSAFLLRVIYLRNVVLGRAQALQPLSLRAHALR